MVIARKDFDISSRISQTTLDSVITSVTQVFRTETAEALKRLQRELNSSEELQSKIHSMHSSLAEEASRVSLGAYEKGGFDSRPYRSEDTGDNKRHPGALGQAIQRGYLFHASRDGSLNAVNLVKLDQFAPHWRRLNYGAGAKGSQTAKVQVRPMRFGRGVGRKSPGFKFAIRDRSPSKAFGLPSGVFSASRVARTPVSAKDLLPGTSQGDAFYPYPRGNRTMTKGIRGVSYIEYGLDYINRLYPQRLTALAVQDMRSALKRSGAK